MIAVKAADDRSERSDSSDSGDVHPGFDLDEHSLSQSDLEYAVELVGEDGVRPTPAGKWARAGYGQDVGSSSDAMTNDDATVSLKKKTRVTWEV